MQNNKKHVKHTIPWLFLFVIARIKVKESDELDLDAKLSSNLDQSGSGPPASKLPSKGKIIQGQ